MVPHTREVLDSPPPDEDHRVLLKVMAHARDIGCHLNSIGQTDSSNLSQGRIGLLGGRSIHAHTDPSLLRALSQGRSRCFLLHGPSRTTYQLVYCRHSTNSGKVRKIISLKINNNKLFCQGLAAPPAFQSPQSLSNGWRRKTSSPGNSHFSPTMRRICLLPETSSGVKVRFCRVFAGFG